MDPLTIAVIGVGIVAATGAATSAMGAVLSCCTIKRVKVIEGRSKEESKSELKNQELVNKIIKIEHSDGSVERVREFHVINYGKDEQSESDAWDKAADLFANGQQNDVASTLAENGGEISKAAADGIEMVEIASLIPKGMEAVGSVVEGVIEGGDRMVQHHKDKKSEDPEQIELQPIGSSAYSHNESRGQGGDSLDQSNESDSQSQILGESDY